MQSPGLTSVIACVSAGFNIGHYFRDLHVLYVGNNFLNARQNYPMIATAMGTINGTDILGPVQAVEKCPARGVPFLDVLSFAMIQTYLRRFSAPSSVARLTAAASRLQNIYENNQPAVCLVGVGMGQLLWGNLVHRKAVHRRRQAISGGVGKRRNLISTSVCRLHRKFRLRRLVRQRRLQAHASDDRRLAPRPDLA
jgi:hypothetical protein